MPTPPTNSARTIGQASAAGRPTWAKEAFEAGHVEDGVFQSEAWGDEHDAERDAEDKQSHRGHCGCRS